MEHFKVIHWDFSRGYPAGENYMYQCGICGVRVVSNPEHVIECECGNIHIDSDSARVVVSEPSKISILKK